MIKSNLNVVSIVDDWFADNQELVSVNSVTETEQAIEETTQALGYGYPFDREQKAINEILIDNRASKIACMTIWGFYHDFKFALVRSGVKKAYLATLKSG